LHQLLGGGARLGDQVERRVAQLRRVVRRDRGRHAHRDALGAVGQQVREGRGQHHGLLRGAVVVRPEVRRVLVEAVEEELGDLGQARLRVAHRRRVVPVDVAEVALALDERVALGEVLREAHERVVDRLVAVGVERAHHVAHDLGAFLERRIRVEAQQPHAVQDAPVHGLQPVPGVGERPVHDRGERVGEVALLQRRLQVDALDAVAARRVHGLAHLSSLFRPHSSRVPSTDSLD
jgi:hypothetical protein